MEFLRDFRNIIGLATGAALIAASVISTRSSSATPERALIAPPPHLEYFSFGFQSVLSDSLWIRAIQDFDYCETKIGKNRCQGNSWLYSMIDTITNLSPDFLPAYSEGGVALSVVVSDSEGASKVFDKGVRVFPKDFPLLYRAALHAYYDEKNFAKAGHLYEAAARAKGLEGDWLYSLATRLYTEAGKKELARNLYLQMKEEGLEEGVLQRMREKLDLESE